MDTADAIIKLVASVVTLVASLLRFVPKAQDRPDKKDPVFCSKNGRFPPLNWENVR